MTDAETANRIGPNPVRNFSACVAPAPSSCPSLLGAKRIWQGVGNLGTSEGIGGRTMSGRNIDSHMPESESGAVPATMKSFAVSMAPMLSMPAM